MLQRILFFLLPIFLCTSLTKAQDFWEIINSPQGVNPVHINISSSNILYLGTSQGVYVSNNEGQKWNNIGLNDRIVLSLTLSNNNIYAGVMSIGSGIYKYLGNTKWEKLITTDNILVLLSNNDNIFAGTWGGIYKSYDSDTNWQQTLTITSTAAVFSIAEDNNGTLYAGATNFTGGEGVFKSTDQGDSWEYFGLQNVYVTSLAVNSNNELFAGAQGHHWLFEKGAGVYKYDNELQDWTQLKDSLIVVSMVINSEDAIYVGLSNDWGDQGGVFVSYDNGLEWFLLESGLGKDYMKQLTLSPDERIYTISGWGTNTIHRSTNPTVGIIDHSNITRSFVLNYPNPFLNKTYIYYRLPKTEDKQLTLKVYDLAGNIRMLEEFNVEGLDYIKFFRKNLKSGIYIYELIADKYSLSNKMIIK